MKKTWQDVVSTAIVAAFLLGAYAITAWILK